MLSKKPLTQRTIDSLRATGERFFLWDALCPGFAVRVTETGYKSYVLCLRFPGSPHPSTRAIGTVGRVSLEWARAKAREWCQAVAEGRDPAIERAETFKAIAEEYLAREGGKLRSLDQRKSILERSIFPALGARPISEIRRGEVVRLLDLVEDERGPEAAHKVLGIISKVMGWHASRSDSFKSPIVKGMGRTEGNARDRVLNDEELRRVWLACDGVFGQLIRFLLLTATRKNEAARMTWSELENGDWIIPRERFKSGVEHVIPLSNTARDLLATMPRLGPYVFTTNGRVPISGFTKFKDNLDQVSGVSDWVIHDTRRVARSLLSRAGVSSDVAERCLGHVIGGVQGVYDRHSYHREKQVAFEKLATLLGQIISPQENVVALKA